MKYLLFTVPILAAFASFAGAAGQTWKNTNGLYAIFNTSQGTIVCRLFEQQAPKTVENFVGLAKGEKEFVNMKTGQKMKKKFYDGLIWHRVIPNFMIQGGCPLGAGTGGPGYKFEDEIVDSLRFDKPGILAMANSGPNTNGSQFFITEVPTPWLNGRHTIFGEVIEGQDVVTAIARVERGRNDKPVKDVVLNKLTIKRVGPEAVKTSSKGKKALFIVASKDFRDEEYFEPKTLLEAAGIKTVTASNAKGEITGMLGGKANSDMLVSEASAADYDAVIFVGGSGAYVFFDDAAAQNIAKDAAAKDKILAAICLAPVTLANSGVLTAKNATVFSNGDSEPRSMLESKGAVFNAGPVVIDGKIITASGPTASKEFGEKILGMLNQQ